MTVLFNTDKSLSVREPFADKLTSVIKDELERFSDIITRLEVHLSDENGHKPGIDDKKCLIEARISNRQPIAVTNFGNNYELAVYGAIDKIKSSLETIVGKLSYQR